MNEKVDDLIEELDPTKIRCLVCGKTKDLDDFILTEPRCCVCYSCHNAVKGFSPEDIRDNHEEIKILLNEQE